MKRIQLDMPEEKVEELKTLMEETGINTQKEFLNLALSLLSWAIKEKKTGRVIASVDEETDKYKEVVMPIF